MTEGTTYIVKKKRGYSKFFKVKIIEITKLTVAVIFEDDDGFERHLLADFLKTYRIIETLESDPIETETNE